MNRDIRSALMVVDVQAGVVASAWDRDRVVGNVALAVARARDAGVPVIWVQHNDSELPRGSPAWQWVPELDPRPTETVVHKSFNSAFEQTELASMLERERVNHLVLAGAATNWCIRATAYAAMDRGYNLTLLEDAHTTESIEFADGRSIHARDIVDDLNVSVRWLTYPGRVNGTACAGNVDFAVVGGTK
jgi:nicotinamidase-related amidase